MGDQIRIAVWPEEEAPGASDVCMVGPTFVVIADGASIPATGAGAARAAAAAAAARLGVRRPHEDLPSVLREAFAAADGAVRAALGSEPEPGRGVAALALALGEGRVHVAHVGVLRAYVLRQPKVEAPALPSSPRIAPEIVLPSGETLTCLTWDHSAIASRVERGLLTREDAKDHPLRDHLVKALGARGAMPPDLIAIEHAQGDRVLLCSEGTWGALDAEVLASLVAKAGSAQAACVALGRATSEARSGGGPVMVVIDFPRELQAAGGGTPGPQAAQKKAGPEALLEQIGRDLCALARDQKLDPVIGREDEIRRLGEILLQRKKANALLVGDAGVGKTCIVEGLAQRLAGPAPPRALRGKRIVEISIAALVAGTKFRGEFEERLQTLIQLTTADPELILFIDELHTVMGAGSGGEALDAANILKPALARGSLRLIGATTTQEYDRHLAKDEALARRFEVVRVEEPARAEATAILRGLRGRFEAHYGLAVADAALDAAVDLSIRYLPERRLPDKAIDLIDQACARRAFGADAEAPAADGADPPIGRREVATILSERSRIPFDLVNQGDRERLLGLSRFLQERVFGQATAAARISSLLTRAYSGFKDPRRPIASFLFVGTTGVGKTETARALAEYLFIRPEHLHRFDMTEFGEKHQVARLLGAPPGYVGHESEGALTSAVRRRPASVVLLDEVEKAHEDVLLLLLQILDEGELTDGHGRRASFRESILVMTTNIVPDVARGRALGFRPGASALHAPGSEPDEALREGLGDRFRPELLGRIGAVISFRPLDAEAARAIADKTIRAVLARLETHGGISVLPEEVRARILERAASLRFGAREIERLVSSEIGHFVETAPS